MLEYLFTTGFLLAAFLGACVFALAGVGSLRAARKFPDGLLHYYFCAVIFSECVAIFLSARNFDATGEAFQEVLTSNPISAWAIRLTSLVALIASADQVIRYFLPNRKIEAARAILATSFCFFWFTNIAIPALFAPHKEAFQLNWCYSLALSLGMIFMGAGGGDQSVRYCRNAIFIYCAASLLLIPIRPDLVLQAGYSQGYLPGVPRFFGLAPHAIIMGLTAAIGLWCLMSHPIPSRSLNLLCWAIGLLVFFLAQAKTVWFSFFVTLPVMFYFQHRLPNWNSIASSRHRPLFAFLIFTVLLGSTVVAGVLMFGGVGDRLDRFFGSAQGAQVLTFTGRDRIWDVALSEWARSPLLGYGLGLFGPEHQIQIRMPQATSGHNQLIDGLGRSGLVGASGTVLFTVTLLWLGLRFGRRSKGLSAVLALSILIRMVTEVPITLGNIGIDCLPYYLLLAVIGASMNDPDERGVARGR